MANHPLGASDGTEPESLIAAEAEDAGGAMAEAAANQPSTPDADGEGGAQDGAGAESSLTDDIAALIDSGRTYAEAELAFQKTRAALVGGSVAKAAAALVVALVLLHIALIALAVGAVLALAPLLTIWGAMGVVVGTMLLGVALLVRLAFNRGKLLAALFAGEDGA